MIRNITINIINFEEEPNLIVRRLSSKLMHSIQKFLKRYRARIILVKYLKDSFGEEWLKIN